MPREERERMTKQQEETSSVQEQILNEKDCCDSSTGCTPSPDDTRRGFPMSPEEEQQKTSLWSLFISFFQIGLFTIGGGLAMVPLLERIAVYDKKWLSQDEMVDCVALSQSLPGVLATNMATYVGNRRRGLPGAIVSTIGVVLPSLVIIMAIAGIMNQVSENTYVQGAFTGIKATVVGLIGATVWGLGRRNLTGVVPWMLALAAFILVGFVGINAVYVIVGVALFGVVYYGIFQGTSGRRED